MTSIKPESLVITRPILDSEIPGYYWLVKGKTAMGSLIHKDYFEVEALVYQITNETQIMDLNEEPKKQNN